MPAMFDAQCSCGRRFGWSGRFADRPPCPRCGARPPQAELDATDARMEEDRRLLASRPDAQVWYKRRLQAGLTLRQAAKAMRLDHTALSEYEQGRRELDDEVRRRMAEAYGVGGPA